MASLGSKYCTKCGKMNDQVPTGWFDPDTGEPLTRSMCPTRECGHTGISHDWRTGGVLGVVLGVARCRKCGYREYLDD